MKTSRGLTTGLALTVCSNKDLQAYEGQQRPLQFGTGSVQQWAAGDGIPHVQLVGMSRQDITDTQKGLKQRQEVRNVRRQW